ncbi:PREDICTED: polycomb group protein Psc-like [Dufourea novaeangliae]|uniref:Polycomb group protein Psc n=1 Tax=Dufourea novaeangliae TaxID=178035 RepID=A0A154PF23_DUFNO|nr:PREDICTED: polycomb group protein Psc-like [Dufourea novaeangliae]KZC10445.1 Polycomb group protein Psc [Dufourea novaeangliae]
MEATEREKPLVKDVNEHIVCPLCRGYLVDATTLVECLHSFCRGCIVRRLSSGARACPVCNVATSPPLQPDVKLQRLVYLLVPGLFRSELDRRRHFRRVNPQCPPSTPPLGSLDLTLDDFVSLSLCELDEPEEEGQDQQAENHVGSRHRTSIDQTKHEDTIRIRSTRYLKCPAGVTVRHLVRLLMLKRGWEEASSQGTNVNTIEMLCERNNEHRRGGSKMMALDQSWTLLDLACIFGWKRESPMKLYYRVTRKDNVVTVSRVSPYNDETSKDATTMENIQRPPTPPPSPKPVQECEVEARRILESSTEPARSLETNLERDKEPKAKKPRCEVTPVMRTPDLVPMQTNHVPESSKTKELTRLEHRKRRKRRNKRVIAEITTTPREDLLKLKVRLTPCPSRITSTTGAGQTKEKLLQMRAVRREKIKATAMGQQRSTSSSLVREEGAGPKDNIGETEETIEEIIDSIPDEVVRIAQNISTPAEETSPGTERMEPRSTPSTCRSSPKSKEETEPETAKAPEKVELVQPKKDEEILRRLGLVAVNESGENFREKTKQRVQSNSEKNDSMDREKLEKQLRESKANRVRSLLAEKQMRDTLKSIMSKTKEEQSPNLQVSTVPKKKGPPPLAPLRVAKPSGFAASSAILEPNNSKYEIPLDLSSGGTVHNNVLDLSANLSTGNFSLSSASSSSSSSSSPSSSSSSSSSSSCSVSSLNTRPVRPGIATGSLLRGKTKDSDQRRGQESNLVTLSDAAVSLLSGCISDKNSVDPLVLGSGNIASKVALRIPQPHQRISGFGMKIKPNLSIRHIPNPQAVVASQYRNQRASYFNTGSQQPP